MASTSRSKSAHPAGTEAEIEAEITRNAASRRLLGDFAYTSQSHRPRDGAAHGGLGPSSAIISLDNLCQNSHGPV